MALFLLPQIPPLLEHLGISATRGLETFCNGLARLFIGQPLLQSLTEYEGRREKKHELCHADARVNQARKCLKTFASSSASFFANNTKASSLSANDQMNGHFTRETATLIYQEYK